MEKKQTKKENTDSITLPITIGGLIMLILVLTTFWGDYSDDINTREFGKQICQHKGLTYSHRTIQNRIPKIYCKENNTKPLYDGIMYQIT